MNNNYANIIIIIRAIGIALSLLPVIMGIQRKPPDLIM